MIARDGGLFGETEVADKSEMVVPFVSMSRSALHPGFLAASLVLALLGSVNWFTRESRAQPPEPQIRFLEGHQGAVNAVAFSTDGKLLLSAGQDGTVRAWDRATGRMLNVSAVLQKPIVSLAVAPNGLSFATGDLSGGVRLFDLGRPYPVLTWGGSPGQIIALQPSADGQFLLAADTSGMARWLYPQAQMSVRDVGGATGPLVAGAVSDTHSLLFLLSVDGTLRAVKLPEGQPAGLMHVPPAAAAALFPNGTQAVVGGQDGWLRRVSWPTPAPQPLGTHADQATSIVAAPNGEWLASGGVDQQVLVFKASDGALLTTLKNGPGRITSVAASSDSSRVIAAGDQGAIKVWQVNSGEVDGLLTGHAGAVHSLVAHPKSPEFATAGADGIVRLWSLPTSRQTLAGPGPAASRVISTTDGKTHWVMYADLTARAWQWPEGKSTRTIDKLPEGAGVWSLTSDQRVLLLSDAVGNIWPRATEDGAALTPLGAHVGPLVALERQPQGTGWLTAGADGMVKIWGRLPEAPTTLPPLPQPPSLVASTPDGKLLLAAQPEGALIALDVNTRQPRHSWSSNSRSPLKLLSVASDGQSVWVADEAGMIRGWSLASGEMLGEFSGMADVTSLSLSPQADWLVTTSADGAARLWNIKARLESLTPAAPLAGAPGAAGKAADKEQANAAAAAPPLPLVTSVDGLSAAAGQPDGRVLWRRWPEVAPVRADGTLRARPRALALRPDALELAAGDIAGEINLIGASADSPLVRWLGHEGEVTGLSYHLGGAQLASSGRDGVVRLWQLPLVPRQSMVQHPVRLTAFGQTFDGGRVYSADDARRIRATDTNTGELLYETKPMVHPITGLATSFDNSLLAVADSKGGVGILSSMDGGLAFRIQAHAGAVRDIAFPQRASPWVSVGDDGQLRVWDYPTPPRILMGHEGAIEQVSLSPNGQQAASSAADKTIRLWNLGDGAASWTLAHDMPIRAMAWKGDSQQLASADAAHRVRVWNLADGQQMALFDPLPAPIVALAWSPDGTLLAATADGNVKFWNVAEKKETAMLPTGAPLVALAVSESTQSLVTAHADGQIKKWRLADREPIGSIAIGAPIERLAVTRDGKSALVAANDKSLRLVSLETGAAGARIPDLPGAVSGIAWSADALRFAATLADGTVRVWDATGELSEQFDIGQARPSGVSFVPDGKGLIVGGDDRAVRMVRLLALRKIPASAQPLTGVAFSNDATTVAVSSRDKLVTLWNITSGAAVRSLGGSGDAVTAVSVSPDGTKVVASSLDKNVRVWNLADGQLLATIPQPAAALGVRVSRDGQRLVVAASGGVTRVLDLATARTLQVFTHDRPADAGPLDDLAVVPAQFGRDNQSLLVPHGVGELHRVAISVTAAFPAHVGGVNALAWSPNGAHLISAGADKQVKVHDTQGKPVVTMQGGEFDVVAMSVRRDGAGLAAVTRDNHLVIWQIGNGQQEQRQPLPFAPSHVAYSFDQSRAIVVGSGAYRVWQLAPGKWIEQGPAPMAPGSLAALAPAPVQPPAQAPHQAPRCLTLDAHGEWRLLPCRMERLWPKNDGQAATASAFLSHMPAIAVGYADKSIAVFDIHTGAAVRGFGGANDAITGVAVSRDGMRVAAASADKMVRTWNFDNGGLLSTVELPAVARRLVASPDGARFLVVGDDQVVRVFEFATGRQYQHWRLEKPVTNAGWLDPTTLYVAGPELGTRTLKLETSTQWLADPVRLHVAAWMPDGKQLVTCGEDRVVKLWNVDGTLVRSFGGYPVPPTSLDVRPDGAVVALAGQKGGAHPQVFLWRIADGQQLPTLATPAGVLGIAWSADGKLAVAGADQKVRVYAKDSLLLLEDMTLESEIRDLAWTEDGVRLVVATANGQTHVLVPAARHALAGHQNAVTGVAYAQDGTWVVTGGVDQTIRVWDRERGLLVAQCAGMSGQTLALSVSPDGQRLAVASSDNQLRVWRLDFAKLGEVKSRAEKSTTPVEPLSIPLQGSWPLAAATRSVRWSPDGTRLITAADDGSVRSWQVATEPPTNPADFARELQRWTGHSGAVYAAVLSTSGKEVFSAGTDRQVIRNVIAVSMAVKAQEGTITELLLSADGQRLVSAGADKLLGVWDANTLARLHTLSGSTAAAKALACDAQGSLIFSADEAQLRVWSGKDGKPIAAIAQPAPITALVATRDGTRLFVATADHAIRPYQVERNGDAVTLVPGTELRGPNSPVTRLALARDERRLYSGHTDQSLSIWLVPTNVARREFDEHRGPVYGVSFAPDGEMLASVGADRTVRLWSVAEGKMVAHATTHGSAVQSLAFAPQGKELATAGADGTVQFLNLELKPLEKLTVGLTGRIHSVAYSPDGSQVLVGGSSRAWQAFQRASLLRLKNVEGHNDTIYRVALNPAGNRLATLDYSGHLAIWDVGSGTLVYHQQLPVRPAYGCVYAPDGAELAVATRDARVVRVTIPAPAR